MTDCLNTVDRRWPQCNGNKSDIDLPRKCIVGTSLKTTPPLVTFSDYRAIKNRTNRVKLKLNVSMDTCVFSQNIVKPDYQIKVCILRNN